MRPRPDEPDTRVGFPRGVTSYHNFSLLWEGKLYKCLNISNVFEMKRKFARFAL